MQGMLGYIAVYKHLDSLSRIRHIIVFFISAHILSPPQDDRLSYDEVLAQFDVLVDSPLTDYGHAVHEEL